MRKCYVSRNDHVVDVLADERQEDSQVAVERIHALPLDVQLDCCIPRALMVLRMARFLIKSAMQAL